MEITNSVELQNAIKEGFYDKVEYFQPTYIGNNVVLDENESVKWNREEIQRLNEEMKTKAAENQEKRYAERSKMTEDIIRIYADEYNVSPNKVGVLYNYAYRESHSEGMYLVTQTLEELLELFEDVNKA